MGICAGKEASAVSGGGSSEGQPQVGISVGSAGEERAGPLGGTLRGHNQPHRPGDERATAKAAQEIKALNATVSALQATVAQLTRQLPQHQRPAGQQRDDAAAPEPPGSLTLPGLVHGQRGSNSGSTAAHAKSEARPGGEGPRGTDGVRSAEKVGGGWRANDLRARADGRNSGGNAVGGGGGSTERLENQVATLTERLKAMEAQLAAMAQMKDDWEAHRAAQEFSRQLKRLEEVGIPTHHGYPRSSGPVSVGGSSCALSLAEELASLEGLPQGRYPSAKHHQGPPGGAPMRRAPGPGSWVGPDPPAGPATNAAAVAAAAAAAGRTPRGHRRAKTAGSNKGSRGGSGGAGGNSGAGPGLPPALQGPEVTSMAEPDAALRPRVRGDGRASGSGGNGGAHRHQPSLQSVFELQQEAASAGASKRASEGALGGSRSAQVLRAGDGGGGEGGQARAGSELLLLDAESINGSSSLSPQQQAGPLPGGMWGERGPPSPKGPGSGGRQAFQ